MLLFARSLLFVVCCVGTLTASGIAFAAEDALPPSPNGIPRSKPVHRAAPPTKSELSPSALGMEPDKSDRDSSSDQKDGLKNPGEFKFGDNTLHIDADRKKTTLPGVGDNEETVINKAPTDNGVKPNYFGLRFTTPIR